MLSLHKETNKTEDTDTMTVEISEEVNVVEEVVVEVVIEEDIEVVTMISQEATLKVLFVNTATIMDTLAQFVANDYGKKQRKQKKHHRLLPLDSCLQSVSQPEDVLTGTPIRERQDI